MEPASEPKARPDVTSVVAVIVVGVAVACVLGVLLLWPFAFLYVAVGPAVAFLFVAACFGMFAYAAWRLFHRRGVSGPTN